jgi:hypothetical protein
MVRMTDQTKIIVATAVALVIVDIAVRLFLPTRTVVIRDTQARGDVLTVRQLRVVDDNGNIKAQLKVNSDGEPGLLMWDRTGTERLQLDTFHQVPSLILLDENQNRRVYFGMDRASNDGQYENYSAETAQAHSSE